MRQTFGVRGLVLGSIVFMCSGSGLLGCSELRKPPDMQMDEIVVPQKEVSSLGSLWEPDNGRAFMFEDRRASRIGDIVIVKIEEQHSGSKTANTTADRAATLSAGASGGLFGIHSLGKKFVDLFDVNATTGNEFEGEGSTSRRDSLSGTIAAKVVEVLPNGDLRIQGKREVTVNSEKQKMTIQGIVRRIDLDTQNTVMSSAVADAQIAYVGLGVVDDVQRPGWATRVFDWITPF